MSGTSLPSDWIRTEHRQPPIGVEVLIALSEMGVPVVRVAYRAENGRWFEFGSRHEHKIPPPLWMPIPRIPAPEAITLASRDNAVGVAKFLTVQWLNEHRFLVFVVSLMLGVGLLVQSALDFTSSR